MSLSLDLVTIHTPPCIKCHRKSVMNIPADVYEKLQQGFSVQEAWPYSSPDEREMIISGTHPECWETIFGGSDCD